jgi:uncharacterized protein DUF6304
MEWSYPTRYSDRRGVELTTLRNDGAKLSLRLRDIMFWGRDFDSLQPDPDSTLEALSNFDLHWRALCNCRIECKMPIAVVVGCKTTTCPLEMRLDLGRPTANGGLDTEVLTLSLYADGQAFRSAGNSGWFEDELLSLQSSLPQGTYLKACISCAHSDYSPYGHGLFGGMACFRNLKEQYSRVKDKFDLFPILDEAEVVQETYLCPEFEKRQSNAGYRG